MILRVDLLLWGLAAVLALGAGMWRVRAARRRAWSWWPVVPAGLALAGLIVSLLWQFWLARLWPGAAGADGLILLAGGALACGLWQDWRSRHQTLVRRAPAAAWIQGLAQGGVALLLFAALLGSDELPAVPPASQVGNWLLGLRNVLAGLGLGGWLILTAGAAYEVAGYLPRLWPRRPTSTPAPILPAEPVPAAMPQPALLAETATPLSPPAVGLEVAAPAAMTAPSTAPVAAVDPPDPAALRSAPDPVLVVHDASRNTDYALRFSYPWLTAALLLGGWWSVTAYATPWRARPAELWLAVAWLLAGVCLHAAAGWRSSGLLRVWSYVLAVLGLLAALLAAWQIPTLFS